MEIEKIREFFSGDRFAIGMGAHIDSADTGEAVISLELRDGHLNGNNAVQGGVIFTLADFSCAVASCADGSLCVSADGHISYLSVAKGKKLYATARCIKPGRTLNYYETLVTDELGTNVAKGSFTMFRVREQW